MDISIFSVIGPVMIGPSSSHTAGAAKLARIAGLIIHQPFDHISFGLHGSFAKTYKGHGTDRALVAGAMGFYEDDERLADSMALADAAGLSYDFYETDLKDMHENSVKLTFTLKDGSKREIVGSSIGGGQIVLTKIDGFDTDFTAESSALFISQKDKPGIISEVTGILAMHSINIGVMKVSRTAKNDLAFCIIETDDRITDEVILKITKVEHVLQAQAINITGQEK